MIKTFFRFCPCISRISFGRYLVSSAIKSNSSRPLSSLPQESSPKETSVENLIHKKSDLNERDLPEVKEEQNAPEKSFKRGRQLQHPRSLAEAVYRSEFLRNMVDIGVNLYKIQKLRPLDLDFITSLRSWDPDIPERLNYLLQLGVHQDSLANIITENPRILKENLEDMQVRVNYLLSKKFTPEDISIIVAGCPKLLSMTSCPARTPDIDSRLGYFQHGYKLSGNQVRQLAIANPWMISWPEWKLRNTLDTLQDILSFNITDMKFLILNNGKIWKIDAGDLRKTAEFLHFELKMSHKKMVQYGHLLTKPLLRMKFRYEFMVFMKRANFDTDTQYYKSYDILWKGTLEEFCKKLNTNMEALDLFAKSV